MAIANALGTLGAECIVIVASRSGAAVRRSGFFPIETELASIRMLWHRAESVKKLCFR
jgi:hypothetical protein